MERAYHLMACCGVSNKMAVASCIPWEWRGANRQPAQTERRGMQRQSWPKSHDASQPELGPARLQLVAGRLLPGAGRHRQPGLRLRSLWCLGFSIVAVVAPYPGTLLHLALPLAWAAALVLHGLALPAAMDAAMDASYPRASLRLAFSVNISVASSDPVDLLCRALPVGRLAPVQLQAPSQGRPGLAVVFCPVSCSPLCDPGPHAAPCPAAAGPHLFLYVVFCVADCLALPMRGVCCLSVCVIARPPARLYVGLARLPVVSSRRHVGWATRRGPATVSL